MRILELLVVVGFFGFASIALKQATPSWCPAFCGVAWMIMLASVLLAIARKLPAKMFWIGFAVSSISYAYLIHALPGNGAYPEFDGYEPTTMALDAMLEWLHPDWLPKPLPMGGGMFNVADEVRQNARPILTSFQGIGMGGGNGSSELMTAFLLVGHNGWALLFGWIGGHFTQFVYRRSNPIA